MSSNRAHGGETPGLAAAASRHELRHRLRMLGLPLVLEPAVRRRSLPARTMGVHTTLALLFVALAVLEAQLDPLLGDDLSVDPASFDPQGSLLFWLTAASAVILASPLLGWLAALALRLAPQRWRDAAGTVPIVVLLVAPSVIGSGTQPTILERLAAVAITLAATYWGVGTIIRWASRRALRELSTLGPVVSRLLPVLMITVLFFFFNAEIWQVAVKLDVGRTLGLAGVLTAMAVLLVTVTARDEISEAVAAHRLECGDEAAPLRRPERMNILLIAVLVTMMQFVLVALLVFVFFVLFGVLTLPDATAQSWMNEPPKRFTGILSALPVSTVLVKVCTVLAAFSALNFVATASGDRVYRDTFVEPTLRDLREGLRVREAYLASRPEPTELSEPSEPSRTSEVGETSDTKDA